MKTGIYFLILRKVVVYVGQSRNLNTRIKCHPDKNFDRIRLIECSAKKMAYYERRWIRKFNPKYNKSLKHSQVVTSQLSVKLDDDDKKMLKKMCKKNNRSAGNQMIFAMKQQYYRQFNKSKATEAF